MLLTFNRLTRTATSAGNFVLQLFAIARRRCANLLNPRRTVLAFFIYLFYKQTLRKTSETAQREDDYNSITAIPLRGNGAGSKTFPRYTSSIPRAAAATRARVPRLLNKSVSCWKRDCPTFILVRHDEKKKKKKRSDGKVEKVRR